MQKTAEYTTTREQLHLHAKTIHYLHCDSIQHVFTKSQPINWQQLTINV